MNKSSFPEPPILADLEKARNCFGLNATVLPGLGTFRAGKYFRGLCEMGSALGGTLFFCFTLLRAVRDREEDITLMQAFRPHFSHLALGVVLVLGSWISGVRFAKGLFPR
ncbi:MAG: hypothetical protein EB056_06065 [Verrucomicrobia bacterium]|nr:hypothetical protein [Verrucomicrobiota bacterium]